MASFIIGSLIMSLSIGAIVGIVLFITRRMNAPGCVHQWKSLVRIYRKPYGQGLPEANVKLRVEEYLQVVEKHEAMRLGQTLVVLACEKCGAVRDRVYPGMILEEVPDEQVSLESDGKL